jgi:putative ATP-dependent endonuclease of the OLD family
MKLVELKLTGFRGYERETSLKIDALTVLVGRNDAGKSSIFDALDIFFNELAMDRADCCVRRADCQVRIACVFEAFPESIVIDEQHSTSLASEYLLRDDLRLEIVKTFDCGLAKPKLTNISAFALHPTADKADDLLSLKLTELKTRAKDLGIDLKGVNVTAKAAIRKAIWDSVRELSSKEREVPLAKESAKDVYDQLSLHMPSFALFKSDRTSTDQDAEAQDPMKAAIKEAIGQRARELDNVLSDIQRELKSVAARTVEKIRELSPDLASELNPTVENRSWDSLFKVALTGEDDIPINKRGSGTRRLILLSFFRARAEANSAGKSKSVIYAVEEPETSQHPNHQLMLLDAFERLSEQNGCQVLLTTHTPTLARRVDQSALRLIIKSGNVPIVENCATDDKAIQRIVDTLGVLPDHDIKVFFGVEGKHDISFLKAISSMLASSEGDIPDLDAREKAGELVFVPLGGSSLELWVNRLKGLNRAEFYLTDRDDPPPKQAKYHAQVAEWNSRGCTAWATNRRELENYLDFNLIKSAVPSYAGTGNDFDDVPQLWAEAQHEAAHGPGSWSQVASDDRKQKMSAAKKRLNGEIVRLMTPALLTAADANDEVRGWLRQIGQALNKAP